jgi:predicted phage terminase large subunit-like protein
MRGLSALDLTAVRRERARRHLLPFIQQTLPTYVAGWFQEELCAHLEQFYADVKAGKSPRLAVFAPPRHGKTEAVSRRFPAWVLGQDPDIPIILSSYSAALACRTNRDIQRIIASREYGAIFPATRMPTRRTEGVANADFFEVAGREGGVRAAGVGGGITGMGGRILVIDDPVKDAAEANSQTIRDAVWEWYASTFYTRLAPGGGVLFIMTRWHEDDLAGRLLAAAARGEGDQWTVVNYPAVAERDEYSAIDGRLLRREGEALHAARYPLEALEKIRVAVGPRHWAALYRQNPEPAGGAIYRREWWKRPAVPDLPPAALKAELGITRVVSFWDTAFKTAEQNDETARVTIGVAPSAYYVLDVWHGRLEFPELEAAIRDSWAKWGDNEVLVEDKASGQSVLQTLRREAGRIPLFPVPVTDDKVTRAHAATPPLAAGLVCVPADAPWAMDFLDQLAAFPNAAHDDMADAFAGAMLHLINGSAGMGIWEFMRAEAEAALRPRDAAPLAGVTVQPSVSPWHGPA